MSNKWWKTSWLGKITLLINLFFAAFLLGAYLCVHVAPQDFWPLAFLGLAFPFLLVINLGFVMLWLLRRRFYFLISLLVVISGYWHVGNIWRWNPRQPISPHQENTLNILSYNVRVFDLYNYQPGWKPDFTNRNNIFKFFQEKDFDILCLQEFVHDRSRIFKTLDTIPGLVRARHAHFEYVRQSKNLNYFGLATFSAWPIVSKGSIEFPSNGGNSGIYTDIKMNQDTIRIINVHLESIGLSEEDYIFMEGIFNRSENPDYRSEGRRILRRMRNAYIVRSEQARILADFVAQSPYPVILAGDFNDTPVSYVYRKVSLQLEDAFKSGHGFGQTYIGFFPVFRIDYIMHSRHFVSNGFTTGKQKYSDHYPIYARLQLQEKSAQ